MVADGLSMAKIAWNAYWELCKPRVVSLIVFTALVGMFLAVPGLPPWGAVVWGGLGIALAAASAAALNHLADQHADALMRRTQHRPLPAGELNERQVLYFALGLGVLGLGLLALVVNGLTALLTFVSLIGYAVVYTLYLKRATPQNIVIGGAAGAAPPVLGWVAVTGELHPHALLLFLIIFTWTPPHFWALAIHRCEDYARADIPMLPVTHGVQFTRLQILLYTLLLTAATLLPFATGMSGWGYLGAALCLDAGFLYYALRLALSTDPRWPMLTFGYSIAYLFALFTALLIDHYLVL
jgi:protoheme IX farnesyltransferase